MSNNPSSPKFEVQPPKPLPTLSQRNSPNQSSRGGVVPYLIVIHRPVGEYGPSINWLCNPQAQASAHVITEGRGTGADVATQLVPWDRKAWACMAFNAFSYNIEADDDAWDGDDWSAFYEAAHITAWLCHKTGIPAVWTQDPLHKAGICRHLDLGQAGGGHSDPTSNMTLWNNFIKQVKSDVQKTHWRASWGNGALVPIKGR